MTKNKQFFFSSILVFLSWADLSAQLKTDDVAYLKNGSVIRGKITHETVDSIKIETYCYNIFAFSKQDLLELKQEKSKNVSNKLKEDFISEKKGLYSYNTLGIHAGTSDEIDAFTYTFQTQFGYEFNHLLGVGLGIGIENLKTELLPLFLSIKSNLLKKASSPIICCITGYSYPLNTKKSDDYYNFTYDGGFLFGLDIGICSFSSNKLAITVTAGYRYQKVKESYTNKYYYGYENMVSRDTYEFNKIAIKVGFLLR